MKKNYSINLIYPLLFVCFQFVSFDLLSQKTDSTKTAPAKTAPIEDEGSMQHMRFGLRITPAINWYNVINKTAENSGSSSRFGGGLIIESNLTKTVSFQTGLGVDVAGGTIAYNSNLSSANGSNSIRYFYNKFNMEIVKFDKGYTGDSSYSEYILKERTYKQTYISVPLNLRMKTSYFGKNRFYGQLGFELQFKWNAYSNDVSRLVTYDNSGTVISNNDEKLTKLDVRKDIGFFNMPLNMGIGLERRLGETSAILLSLNYYLGIFNAFDKTSDYLQTVTIGSKSPTNNQYNSFSQNVRLNRLGLNIAVLF